MRVIAGKARSLPLKTIEGLDTRPTTDRIKETLFNMLQPNLPMCRFLDLFSGSGGIGIEALSRGASYAVFIENNRKAVACIEENLAFTKLKDDARVMACDCVSGICQLEGSEPFDYIFMDPPYKKGLEEAVLTCLKDSDIVTEDTVIIIEASLEDEFSYLDALGFELYKTKNYKTNKHIFVRKKENNQ